MSQNIRDQKRKLFNNFDPTESLHPDSPFYVDYSSVRLSNEINSLLNNIEYSDTATHQLIIGHRGCGKTTELYRLQQKLEQQDYLVVYCEADKIIDINDVKYTEVLLTIVQHLVQYAKNKEINIETNNRAATLIENLVNSLKTMELSGLEVDAYFLKLNLETKSRPDARREVREALSRTPINLLEVINQYIEQVKQAVQKEIVFIVDNLDRVSRELINERGDTTHDALFIDAADLLTSIKCHVIYTVPTALALSNNGPKLRDKYTHCCTLPMIPVISILEYRDNEGYWYDVNPVLKQHIKFRSLTGIS